MSQLNGKQLYGLSRLIATLKMAAPKEVHNATLKQKLAFNYAAKQMKMTELNGKIYTNTFTPYFPSKAYNRYLKGVKDASAGKHNPIVTNFAVTAWCPCKCWHCSFSDRNKKDEMSLDDLKINIGKVQDMGVSVIGITGGEPLLRKDLENIVASIDERSMPLLFTTGYKLIRERVRDLKKAGLEIPVISLDHYRAEIHDKGRGVEGMFDTALNAIELFKSEGFYTAVSFVPDKKLVDDEDELNKVIKLFRELGVNDMRLTSPIRSGCLTDTPEEILSDKNRRTLAELQEKCVRTKGYPGVFGYDYFESKKYYGCGAGFHYMFIDSQGNLCPCDFTMISLGNVKERPLEEIWRETGEKFRYPGCSCYANTIADTVLSKEYKTRPLNVADSIDVIQQHSPYQVGELPVFFQKMGMNPPSSVPK